MSRTPHFRQTIAGVLPFLAVLCLAVQPAHAQTAPDELL